MFADGGVFPGKSHRLPRSFSTSPNLTDLRRPLNYFCRQDLSNPDVRASSFGFCQTQLPYRFRHCREGLEFVSCHFFRFAKNWIPWAGLNRMRFHFIDRIESIEPGKSLRAIRRLTLAEEYLADHFPTFPVMPGVLQLQALVEAGSWLLREMDGFSRSVWVLREVRGVKYGMFVAPGHRLEITVDLTKCEGDTATLKGRGEVDGQQTIAATIVLAGYNLRNRNPGWAERDEFLVRELRAQFDWLVAGGR